VATNETSTPADWVGRLIDRRFPLFEWLRSAESGEIFRTELPGPNTQPAAIRLVSAEIEGAQAQFDDWAQAEGLSHPNLLRIFESGHGRIDENEFLYVVMELPEETLAQVLPTRALTASEVGEMLPPILDALACLHAKGLVHGHVTPSNVLVVGDRVKLSADTLQQTGNLRKLEGGLRVYDAPEIAQDAISPASDVWSLGVTLVEALTQLPPMRNANAGGDPGVPKFMPEPFAEIARKCLRIDPAQRASLAEVEAIFRTPPVRSPSKPIAPPAPPAVAPRAAAIVPTPPAPASPAAGTPSAPVPKPAEPVLPKLEQVAFAFDEVQPSRRALRSVEDENESRRPRISTPMIVGLAALVLVLIAALFVRSHKPKPEPAPETQTASEPASTSAPQAPPANTQGRAPTAKGAAADRVMPDVSAQADKTIHGKVSVKVRLWIDRNGAVYRSALDFDGKSRYFANLALEAAKKWHFKPAQIKGQPVPSIWVLRFDFRRGKTDVTPVQVTP
jgi:serine/threonine protein kinase